MKYLKSYNTFILEKSIYLIGTMKSLVGENIPEFVDGDFHCTNSKLINLIGSPKEVTGKFDCYHNELISLEGISEKIGGNLNCSNNKLTSLEYCPTKINGNFDCSYNNLTDLKYSPKDVSGYFTCYNNNLISLKGAPEYIGRFFNCAKNKLKKLDYLPKIGGNLCCFDNDWEKPIPYHIMIKYNLKCKQLKRNDVDWVYTTEQYNKFKTLKFQKEFLEREPENFMDLKPIGYAKGIEKLFPHLFDMDELGLID